MSPDRGVNVVVITYNRCAELDQTPGPSTRTG